MSDTGVLLSAMIVSFSFALSLIAWKLLSCHASLYGTDARSRDRERQDYLRTITQMTEKLSAMQSGRLTEVSDVTRLHMQERDHSASLNAEIEKKAVENGRGVEPSLVSTADPELTGLYR